MRCPSLRIGSHNSSVCVWGCNSINHCRGSCAGLAINELISVGPTATHRPSWDVLHFQNLSQSKCNQTCITDARRLGAHRPFPTHLHLLDFRFRSVTLSVFLCFACRLSSSNNFWWC
eukprot:SAG31_NODE_14919_length_780_cov_1.643172_2_plen_116_part_01